MRLPRAGKASRNGRKTREVKAQPPELFVRTQGDYTAHYAQARIRVRKGCYQYLVWRDGEKTREFYLGKKESRTPRSAPIAPAPASSCSSSSSRSVRGKK
jgi:hypothetical protein